MSNIVATPKIRSFYEIDEDFPKRPEDEKNSIVAYPIPNINQRDDHMITGGISADNT